MKEKKGKSEILKLWQPTVTIHFEIPVLCMFLFHLTKWGVIFIRQVRIVFFFASWILIDLLTTEGKEN